MRKTLQRRRLSAVAWILVSGALALPTLAVDQFKIVLNPGPGLLANPDALASFQRAAAEWEARIASPIHVNIDADLDTSITDPNIIGSTSIVTPEAQINVDYNTVRNAMAARANRPGNAILAALPTSAQVQATVPTAAPFDPATTFDRSTIGITRANEKALGLISQPLVDSAADGIIKFNAAFSFAYDRASLSNTKVDFQTAAAHEIGHVLGFLSDVDDFDSYTNQITSDNLTTLDLFRFNTSNIPTTASQFTSLARELRPGQESVLSDGTTNYPMSTGLALGDGRQASHWKDDFIVDASGITIGPTIGIMDPTLSYNTVENVGDADLRAMELIGYDTVVPEPGSLAGGAVFTMAVLMRRRRQKARE